MKPTTIAPTIDEIAEALRTNTLVASKNITDALAEFVKLSDVEQFNFGKLTFAAIGSAACEACEFVQYGVFQLPYEVCFYRTQLSFENLGMSDEETPNGKIVGASYVVLPAKPEENYGNGVHVISLCKSEGLLTAVHCVNKLRIVEPTAIELSMANKSPGDLKCECVVRQSEISFWEDRLKKSLKSAYDPSAYEGAFFTDSAQHIMGLTMIINTKGVPKERTEPPRKPNKARAAKGLPLLPYTTRVSTAMYMAAERSEGGGTHASPRPHRRRAHVRTYRNDDGSIHHVTPIAAMLVNWDGGPLLKREAYNVSTD